MSTAFDPTTRRFYSETGTTSGDLVTVHADTGVVSSVPFAQCCIPLFALAAATGVEVPLLGGGALLLLMLSIGGVGVLVLARR